MSVSNLAASGLPFLFAGKATIPATDATIAVSIPGLTANAKVLISCMSDPAAATAVWAVPTANTLTITASVAVTADTVFTYLVLSL